MTSPGTYPTGDPATAPGYSEQAAEQLRKAVRLSESLAACSEFTGEGQKLRKALDDTLRIAEDWISLAAIAEHMVMSGENGLEAGLRARLDPIGEDQDGDAPGVAVAFQPLHPGDVIEEGP
jgi:hypothetical protein